MAFWRRQSALTALDRARDSGQLAVWRQTLYLPLASALLELRVVEGPRSACLAISALSGATLVAAVFLTCLRAHRSLASALLTGTAPAVWFLATTIEIHILQGAVIAVGLLALTSVPRDRTMLRRGVAGAVACAAYLAHESSPLILPGWILLGVTSADPSPLRRERLRELAFVTGAAIVGMLLGLLFAAALKRVDALCQELDRIHDTELKGSPEARILILRAP